MLLVLKKDHSVGNTEAYFEKMEWSGPQRVSQQQQHLTNVAGQVNSQ